ncbi:hypothetical protein SEA_ONEIAGILLIAN_64 [Microbacterium phage OneinaGillian]|uniref:Uncharacterized protein n=1 Tax=Microbacterium phage OneinaGillian TaxID=2301604 RepID=A0A385UJD0_9CAUD|nr:hypothetical protein HOU23_gp064 [Microbacterium phage OneinaGillian]AYB70174.1 hypothetical protein SEA_ONEIAGILLIAN_64 [Microbacterium phage OneinaGillian]
MRVSMSIEGDGVVTEVSREYEPESTEIRSVSDRQIVKHEDPTLESVTQAVASAAATAHNLNV